MNRNESLFNRAKAITSDGTNSPVCAFDSVGGVPRFIKEAEDAYAWDKNGMRYTDYVSSWGPAIVGHARPEVIETMCKTVLGGLPFGASTEGEIVIAEEIAKIMSSAEQLRPVSSDTKAMMTAIRLTRGFTGHDKITKFEDCYHGHPSNLLVKVGSGLLMFGDPSPAGVPVDFTKHILVLEYNSIVQLEEAFAQSSNDIACVILESFAGNTNLVRPSRAFVRALRELTEKYGIMLIYDEVMTGFRVALGGAQSLRGIKPDLTIMGKVIGGGMPLAASGGHKDIVECISPLGGVYQADTLSGNPIAVAAGLKTLEIIQCEGFHENLTALTQRLANSMADTAEAHGVEFTTDNVGGMFGLYFADHAPQDYAGMARSNIEGLEHFFHGILNRSVAFGPFAYEAGFVSAAYMLELIDETIAMAYEVFKETVK